MNRHNIQQYCIILSKIRVQWSQETTTKTKEIACSLAMCQAMSEFLFLSIHGFVIAWFLLCVYANNYLYFVQLQMKNIWAQNISHYENDVIIACQFNM